MFIQDSISMFTKHDFFRICFRTKQANTRGHCVHLK